MRRLFLLCAVCIAAISCGEASDSLTNGHGGEHSGTDNNALSVELEPRLQVIGLNDLLEVIDIHGLQFQARINLTPAGLGAGGDSVPIQFTLDESGARSETLERALQLSRSGRYNVYLEVAPLYENTASVRVESEISATVDQLERLKADFEPAPSPADEYEPAPSPADEFEPAPSPADGHDDEPAPSPADEYEPAPSPADSGDEEPAPSPAEPAPSPAEPAPSPAEPAPSPAEPSREKPGDSPFILDPQGAVENGALLTHSYRTYYFHTGLVEITGDEHELVVTWDVRHWLSKLLADQLDLTVTSETDLRDVLTDFRIEAR